ncbi:uncharacterized protein BO80DRAFT_429176 [Aspergillus ibericus CBS 121593]|uniref:ATP phosphoribosyltransferase n=1 Tax=Aspergillus ibericus CBS 121593 TaxID=1448316 RepID=A0A395GLV8_9EURO|nr:hypothetical protein BO80DRAFT_429176 [Aspergillus ibericus CBS 121593]RAK96332.1 hypothetical protein BO80DRAFT_429176 [Aspergillus ibericus CBS 121593]
MSTLAGCIPRTAISPSFRNRHSYRLFRTVSSSRSPLSLAVSLPSTRFPTTSINTSQSKYIPSPLRSHPNRTMSSAAIPDRYKLVYFVPHSHHEACKEAVFATGAGTFPGGKYTKACFQAPGLGQFLPSEGANPAIGQVGTVETVEEMKVEVMCLGREVMLQAVEALVKAHPYEEVAYEVYKMENV